MAATNLLQEDEQNALKSFLEEEDVREQIRKFLKKEGELKPQAKNKKEATLGQELSYARGTALTGYVPSKEELTAEQERKSVYGIPFPTGKKITSSGEEIYDPMFGAASGFLAGFTRGYTTELPESVLEKTGVIDKEKLYRPEEIPDKIAYTIGKIWGMTKSPIFQGAKLFIGKPLSSVISNDTILKLADASMQKGGRAAAATVLRIGQKWLSSAPALGVYNLIDTPLGDSIPADLKERLKRFGEGVKTATLFEAFSVLNPDFIKFVSPSFAKLTGLINSGKKTEFLFNVFRAGAVATADTVMQGGSEDKPLEDVLFQIGMSLFFGWKSKFVPQIELTVPVIEKIKKELDEIAKERPGLEPEVNEVKKKLGTQTQKVGMASGEKAKVKEVTEKLTEETPKDPKLKKVKLFVRGFLKSTTCPICGAKNEGISAENRYCSNCNTDILKVAEAKGDLYKKTTSADPEAMKEEIKNKISPEDPDSVFELLDWMSGKPSEKPKSNYAPEGTIVAENPAFQIKLVDSGNQKRVAFIPKDRVLEDVLSGEKVGEVLKQLPQDAIIAVAGDSPLSEKLTVSELRMILEAKDIKPQSFIGSLKPMVWWFTENPHLKQFLHLYNDCDTDFSRRTAEMKKKISEWDSKLTKKQKQDLLIYAYWEQGLEKTLNKMGYKSRPNLDKITGEVYNEVRTYFDQTFEAINEARARAGLQPLEKVKNYFTIVRAVVYDPELRMLVFTNADTGFLQKRFQNLKDPYLEERIENTRKLRLDFTKILASYFDATNKYIAFSPLNAKLRLLFGGNRTFYIGDSEFNFNLNESHPAISRVMHEWGNYIVSRQAPDMFNYVEHSFKEEGQKLVRALQRNLGVAVLSFNLRSALIQPAAYRNTLALLGIRDSVKGLKLLKENGIRFAQAHSKILASRTFDQSLSELWGYVDKAGRNENAIHKAYEQLMKAGKFGMNLLKVFDELTATATWWAGYERAKRIGVERVLEEMNLSSNKVIDKNELFYRYADEIVLKTQASGSAGHIAPFQRTLTGRTLGMFQTFVLNEWKLTYETFFRPIKNKKLTFNDVEKMFRFLFWTTLFNQFYEEVLKLRSPFPTPIREYKLARKEGYSPIQALGIGVRDMAESVPLIGGTIRWSTPYKTMLPALFQEYVDISKGVGKLFATWDLSKFKAEDYSAIGKILGIPATGQVEKMIRRSKKIEAPYTKKEIWQIISGARGEYIESKGGDINFNLMSPDTYLKQRGW